MDPRKQRGLVIAATANITFRKGIWLVPSQTTPSKSYQVSLAKATCTCQDFSDLGNKCKHLYAAEIVAQREGQLSIAIPDADGLNLDQKKPTYRQNWPAYNRAQTKEKARFLPLLFELCKNLKHRHLAEVGRPRAPLSDVVFALAYKVYSTFSSRRFISDLTEAHEKGYLTRPLHYNVMSDYLRSDSLTPVLHELIELSSLPLREVETIFAVDSSGFSSSRFVRWYDEKYGATRSGHDWVKAHIMCGVKTNVVTSVEIRGRRAGDAPLFGPLVRKTVKNFQIEEISADKAYSSEKNLALTLDAGGTPYIPFKSTASGAMGGLWEKLLCYYQLNRDEFLKHYHQRSNAESTFSMIKAKFRDHVRSKTDTAMKNEVLLKILCHNICCVIHSQEELGIEPVFWPTSPDGASQTSRAESA